MASLIVYENFFSQKTKEKSFHVIISALNLKQFQDSKFKIVERVGMEFTLLWYNSNILRDKISMFVILRKGKEMFYLTMHLPHFIYGYMASDLWLRTIPIVRKETCCRHIGYSFRLTARVLLYASSHRQDSAYHGLCYTSRGALAGTSIAQWVTPPWRIDPITHRTELHLAPPHLEIFVNMILFNL